VTSLPGGVELSHEPCPSPCLHRARSRVRRRDIATTLGVTERSAFGIVIDLTTAGHVVEDRLCRGGQGGCRNRSSIQTDLPWGKAVGRERTIGEVLELLVDTKSRERLGRNPLQSVRPRTSSDPGQTQPAIPTGSASATHGDTCGVNFSDRIVEA
jgi:hypothetical protein